MTTQTVGNFSITPEGVVTGPADYMAERGSARLRRIESGTDVVFNYGVGSGRDPLLTTRDTHHTAQEIAAILNAYEQAWMDAPGIDTPYNLFGEVVAGLPEYSPDGTYTADPNGNSDVVVLKDGSTIWWRSDMQAWTVEVEPDGD